MANISFIKTLANFLATSDIIPPLVTPEDMDREKTYEITLPDSPDNVYVITQYDTDIASMVAKNVCVAHIQIIIRNTSQGVVFSQMEKLHQFLLDRPEPIEDITDSTWCIFDVRKGPISLGQDAQGRYLWSLSFPVKTNIF